jgi:hypothetical protein
MRNSLYIYWALFGVLLAIGITGEFFLTGSPATNYRVSLAIGVVGCLTVVHLLRLYARIEQLERRLRPETSGGGPPE